MHTRAREITQQPRNAPTEAAAKPRTRYSSFTADHGRDLGDVLAANMANTANTANMLHDLLNDQHRQRPRRSDRPRRPAAISGDQRQRDQHRPRDLLNFERKHRRARCLLGTKAQRSAPARVASWTRIDGVTFWIPISTGEPLHDQHRRGLSFYWHMNDAQRAKLDTDKLKGHRGEIIENDRIRTAPARGIIINLLLFMCLFLLTFLDINISMRYNMHKRF